jgi:hypothetical protein
VVEKLRQMKLLKLSCWNEPTTDAAE